MKFATVAAALVAALPLVAAHGTVKSIKFGDKKYDAPDAAEGNPFRTTDTPVRQLALLEPISDLSSKDNYCGRGAQPTAKLVAAVTAGESFALEMRGGGANAADVHWVHEIGPIMYYLGACSGSAKDCAPKEWFKVGQLGLKDGQDNVWHQLDLYNGGSVSGKIPKEIADGDYLLRIEIMALHNAMNVGGAETTVSCVQISVSGGGGARPSKKDLIQFPGYKQTDPSILIDVWNGLTSYTPPGPAVFSPSSNNDADDSESTTSKTTKTSTKTPTKPTESATGGDAPVNAAPSPTATKTQSSSANASEPTQTKQCRSYRNRRRALIGSQHARRGIAHGSPARLH